jgi:DNA-binding beta-propeller fold protein YncE
MARWQARVAAFVGAIVLFLQISQAYAQSYSFAFQVGSYGFDDGQLWETVGVAVDATTGNIIVTDYNNCRIQVFDGQGTFLGKLGTPGIGCDGCLYGPVGVVLDVTGNVYVADSINSRVEVFAPSGGGS